MSRLWMIPSWVLLLGIIVQIAVAGPALNTGDVFIAAGQEKKNSSVGIELAASGVEAAFSKIGFHPEKPGNFFFLVLTDTHIYAADEHQEKGNDPVFSRDTAGGLQRIIDEAGAMSPLPAFVVVTGDLVHDAQVEQFTRFQELTSNLNPAVGLHVCRGNHDANRTIFQSVFPERKPYYTFRHAAWTFMVLDSGKNGSLDPRQGEWLKALEGGGGGEPAMVFVHYPVIPYFPGDNVTALYESVVSALSNRTERWVFSGHWHSNFLVRVGQGDGRAVRQVVTTASTGNFGYDIPGYRLVCVEGTHVFATIFHRVGEARYRIDPAPRDWPIFEPERSK